MVALPTQFDSTQWASLFSTLPPDVCDEAACIWFEQWATKKMGFHLLKEDIVPMMPAWHALSNRVEVPFHLLLHERIDSVAWKQLPHYWLVRRTFVSALTCMGWEGFAMRAWSDTRGYAGLLQWIEQQNMAAQMVDDLAPLPEYSAVLARAVNQFPEQCLALPWVVAACIRSAAWGWYGTTVPRAFQALRHTYGNGEGLHPNATLLERQCPTVENCLPKELMERWLNDHRVWLHMVIQEANWSSDINHSCSDTLELWLHWARSLKHPHANVLMEAGHEASLRAILGFSLADAALANTMGLREYCESRATKSTSPTLEIPSVVLSY